MGPLEHRILASVGEVSPVDTHLIVAGVHMGVHSQEEFIRE